MELSCKSEYALLALIELAVHHGRGEPLQIRQIAAQQGIPDRYLEQLLATLRRGGLVRSQRGAKGGYHLAREPWNITLLDALECIEGITEQSTTAQDTAPTVESGIIKDIWSEAQEAAEGVLKKYTLQDLREQRDARSQLNIMYYI